ncbi:TIR domain-containing protein [Nocardia sp. NPDC048505]|uniref:nSTAND1 domain-containing NTPase n=1 Tax=unclassified Nocardia TaxID=2637762 RepID=UPI00340D048C
MTRIFLSHSSKDNAAAIALRQWLIEQDPGLVEDIFLDLDRDNGIPAGTRWKEALVRANERCEAVICLVSAHWQASRECVVEYRTAENLGKRIFSVRLERLTDTDITREWQRCDLFGTGPHTEIDVHGYESVAFHTEGLQRLLAGLRTAGIGAQHFPWPPPADPERSPYRGWQPFQAVDAAIYFGRDAQIVRALDLLRGMRTAGRPSVFAILGPSGTGKSSFLRAGLLPRLARDDRRFVVLDIVRPERAALTGAHGLAAAIHGTRTRLGLDGPSLGEIKAALPRRVGFIRELLRDITDAAHQRLVDSADAPPSLVLPIDQAEEMFGADAGVEGDHLLELLAHLVTGEVPVLVCLTIRTDRYEPFQTAPQLADLETLVFDQLKPLPRTRFREVITGPAARATAAGRRLDLEPALLDKLVADCTDGADTLPLLALTLARLYQDYGDDGRLTLDEYLAMGAMTRVVRTEVDNLLARDPAERRAQLKLLRTAFIPWLATVNPENDQPLRRIARWSDLPAAAQPLIDRFVEARLMVKDHRDGETVVEVAVESLLRQWDELAGWLRAEAEALKDADALEQSALAWERNERDDAWLLAGTRLVESETLATAPGFRERLEPIRGYLAASRRRENELIEAERQRQQEELRVARERQEAAEALAAASARAEREAQESAAAIQQRSRLLLVLSVLSVVIMLVAATAFVVARRNGLAAEEREREALALQLVAQSKAILSGYRDGGDVRAFQLALAALQLSQQDQVRAAAFDVLYTHRGLRWINAVKLGAPPAFALDGSRVFLSDSDGNLRVLDTATGRFEDRSAARVTGRDRVYSPDGTRVTEVRVGAAVSEIRVLDATNGQRVATLESEGPIGRLAFSGDGSRLAVSTYQGTVRVFEVATGTAIGGPWPVDLSDVAADLELSADGRRVLWGRSRLEIRDVESGRRFERVLAASADVYSTTDVSSVALSADGNRVVAGGSDGSIRVWDVETASLAAPLVIGDDSPVLAVALSPDGHRLVAGDDEGRVKIWDSLQRTRVAGVAALHATEVAAVRFTPEGSGVVIVGTDGTVRRWEPDSESLPAAVARPDNDLELVVWFSADGSRLVRCVEGGEIQVLDTRTGDLVRSLRDRDSCWDNRGFVLGNDGRKLMFLAMDGEVRVWDLDTGRVEVGRTNTARSAIAHPAFGRNGRPLVVTSDGDTVQIWDAITGAPVGVPIETRAGLIVPGFAISPDGTRIALGGHDIAVTVWDIETGRQVGVPIGRDVAPEEFVFAPDGNRLATSAGSGPIIVWDIVSGQPVADTVAGHVGDIQALAFDREGTLVASVGSDNSMRIWNAVTGKYVGGASNPGESLERLAYHPGFGFLTLDAQRSVRVWRLYADVAAVICEKLRVDMSAREWDTWVGSGPPRPLCPDRS